MKKEEVIASGLLELYVSGNLSPEQNAQVDRAVLEYPEVKAEVERIEKSFMALSEQAAPNITPSTWQQLQSQIQGVRTINAPRRTQWRTISGWAASIVLFIGLAALYVQQDRISKQLEITTTEKDVLNEQLEQTRKELSETRSVLEIIRDKEFKLLTIPGTKELAPEAFAKIFFNANREVAYIDIQGLPPAPEGKVYQAWSLTLDPLTPTSIGIIDPAKEVESGIYKFENIPSTEAFGITLEPEGGSLSPTLEELYILGMVQP